MNRISAIGLLVAGIILLVWGISASHSLGSNTAEVFTGAPARKTIWLVVGGLILTLSGLAGVWSSGRKA